MAELTIAEVIEKLRAYREGLNKPYAYDNREIPAVRDFEGGADAMVIFLIGELIQETERRLVLAAWADWITRGRKGPSPSLMADQECRAAREHLKIPEWVRWRPRG